jgi:hypothetical protein
MTINRTGTIAGEYVDASNVLHGFVRACDGTITTFDASGAGTGSGQGTASFNINPGDEITDTSLTPNNTIHGFLRIL